MNEKYRGGFASAIVTFCQAQADRHSPESQQRTMWERRKEFYATQFLEDEAEQPPEE